MVRNGEDDLPIAWDAFSILTGLNRERKNAGYNPKGMIQVFEKFKKMEGGAYPAVLNLLSSHPPPADRIRKGQTEISKIGGTGLPYYSNRYKNIKSQF